LGPELRNVYGQFLWGVSLDLFEFIGITECYDEDLSFFSGKYLDMPLVHYKENVFGNSGQYQIDHSFRQQIEAHHSYDMILYNRALQARLNRQKAIEVQK